MKKKLIGILICMLLIITVLPVSGTLYMERAFEPTLFEGNTLYVGGSGPNNYTRIQDAIDNASDGDTVYVYSGYYFENITINASINLIGEDKNSTIIDGYESGTVITILADSVTIIGFAIQNSIHPLDWRSYYGIYIQSDNNNISKNIIGPKNYAGIICDWSNNNTIQRNKFWYNDVDLELRYSNNNNISCNFLGYATSKALHIWESDSNVFYRNDFYKNKLHVIAWEDKEFYPSNNIWMNNYWGRPRLFPKPILVISSRGPFLLSSRIEYDITPSPHPNGHLEMYEYIEENVFLWLRGRCHTEINATSWDGTGFHLGKLQTCEILLNGSVLEKLRYITAGFAERSMGFMGVGTTIVLENATGVFFKRQPLIAKDIIPPLNRVLCFVKKMTIRDYYWCF